MLKEVPYPSITAQNNTGYILKKIKPRDTNIDLYSSISTNQIIQIISCMLLQQIDTEFMAHLSLPQGLSMLEVYYSSTVRTILKLCKDVFLVLDRNNNDIIGIQGKKLTDEALTIILSLREAGKIDSVINTIFSKNINLPPESYLSQKAYELIDENNIDPGKADNVFDNPFYAYLVIGAIRNESNFGMPILGWTISEIENYDCFTHLKKYFKKVYFFGCGENWSSTHLIISEPYHELICPW